MQPQKINYTQLVLALMCVVLLGVVAHIAPHKKNVALAPAVSAINSQSGWEGTWTLDGSDQFENSQIKIFNVQKTIFSFEMNAQDGADSGVLNNTDTESEVPAVSLSGNVASITGDIFDDNGFSFEDKNKQCILRMELQADKLVVSDGGGFCVYGAGAGVSYLGTYHRGDDIAQKTLETSDFFIDHKDSYPAFKKLVGEYTKDFDNLAMIENDTTVPELHADSAEFGVAHALNTSSLIMVAPGNKIWAGIPQYLDCDTAGDSCKNEVVRYFTNVPGYENKMPNVLQKWVPKGDKVLYMNGKDASK